MLETLALYYFVICAHSYGTQYDFLIPEKCTRMPVERHAEVTTAAANAENSSKLLAKMNNS